MTNLENTLRQATDRISEDARKTIIEVEQERVIGGDPRENIRGRTVREMVTNHQITIADRLAMYKEPGWHGLGEVISASLSGREAIDRYLGWRVVQEPVFTEIDGTKRVLPLKANIRSDTKDLLGVVSSDYVVVQNNDLGDFADALLAEAKEEGVGVRMETCGSLLGGRKVFLTLRPDREIRVGRTGQDVSIPLLTLLNGHDGSLAMSAAWTNVRVVCNNTYTSALGSIESDVSDGRAFRIRHMGKVQDYLNTAKACLGLAIKGMERYQAAASKMADKKLNKAEIRAYFEDVYRHTFGPIPEVIENEVHEVQKMKADAVIAEWTQLMGDDTNLFDGIEGTLWSAFNSITMWQDHKRAGEKSRVKSEDRRNHLKLLGQGAVDKRKAFRAAMAIAS